MQKKRRETTGDRRRSVRTAVPVPRNAPRLETVLDAGTGRTTLCAWQGEAVRAIREVMELSQEQLAKEAKVCLRRLRDLENGRANVCEELLERVALGLGLWLSELVWLAEVLRERWKGELPWVKRARSAEGPHS